MKKTILTSLGSVILTLITTLIILEIKAQKEQLIADKIEEIDSQILNESRKLLIHLPKGYEQNKNKRYPIMYALDGTSHDQDVANASNVLNNAKLFPDMIIVGIPNTDRHRDLTPEYIMQNDNPNKLGKGDKFLQFIEDELIPFIEKKYNSNGHRMISGNSRGGLFAFNALLEKPDLFNAIFCYSPAFWRNDNLISKKLSNLLNSKESTNTFVYLSLGTEENEKMKKGFNAIVDILKKNNNLDKKFYFNYTEKATHGTNAYYSIPLALKTWNDEQQKSSIILE